MPSNMLAYIMLNYKIKVNFLLRLDNINFLLICRKILKGCTFDDLCNEFRSLMDKLQSCGVKIGFSYESIENLVTHSIESFDAFFLITKKKSEIISIKPNLNKLDELFKYANTMSAFFYLESVVGKTVCFILTKTRFIDDARSFQENSNENSY